ncbi:MAG: N-acetylneuraminate synthase family protein [bacterium]
MINRLERKKSINIGKHKVGAGHPCFIIAEAGSNHDRKLEQAFQLIDVAAEAGADAVKFQTFSAETLYSRKAPMVSHIRKTKLSEKGETLWDVIKRVEMPRKWHAPLAEHCRKRKIIFLSTPFDEKAVDELEAVGVPAYKIASVDITNMPLLRKTARTGKPIILSTGAANLADIETAVNVIHSEGNKSIILLHCVIKHPPEFEDLNLRAMETMRLALHLPVGFSDHTRGIVADVAAVALGACVIEKHFTLNRSLPGPDHPFALEPDELKEMCQAVRLTEKSLGSPLKRVTPAEAEHILLSRRSLVAARDIKKGKTITRSMLAVKRPGCGIPTDMMNIIIGRKARINIEHDEILMWEMIE